MRRNSGLAGAVALVAVLLLAVGSAGAATSREVFLAQGTTLGGQDLDKGFYKLTWKRNGSDDEYVITLRLGSKQVAKVKGRLEERSEKQDSDGLTFRPDGNGGRALAEIRFAGKHGVIVVGS